MRFNPRARAGRDVIAWLTSSMSVSIHAPARGATMSVSRQSDQVSIHAPARGATCMRCTAAPTCCMSMFQSTRPRGARPAAHVDADRHAIVSIHAPARGATRSTVPITAMHVSIHAPARGATMLSRSSTDMMFQSTRPRGARRAC